jgi:hypothetical protein
MAVQLETVPPIMPESSSSVKLIQRRTPSTDSNVASRTNSRISQKSMEEKQAMYDKERAKIFEGDDPVVNPVTNDPTPNLPSKVEYRQMQVKQRSFGNIENVQYGADYNQPGVNQQYNHPSANYQYYPVQPIQYYYHHQNSSYYQPSSPYYQTEQTAYPVNYPNYYVQQGQPYPQQPRSSIPVNHNGMSYNDNHATVSQFNMNDHPNSSTQEAKYTYKEGTSKVHLKNAIKKL